jgi:hypothetical protein
MKVPEQLELKAPPIPQVDPDNANVAMLVELLQGRDWTTAADLLPLFSKPVSDGNKRWVRALADASRGRIAGGQKGYKLIGEMTSEEYQHWRNWMTHQSDEMRRRVIEGDRVFYARRAVEV